MQETYRKIAEGIKIFGEWINPNDVVIPIGLDGAIIYHLIVDYYSKNNKYHTGFLQNTCNISSKTQTNPAKFENILRENHGKKIQAIDMRTSTGALGFKLRNIAENSDLVYSVLFDASSHADWCAFKEAFEERINWLSKEEYEILNIEEITHEYIAKIWAVKEIKKYIV